MGSKTEGYDTNENHKALQAAELRQQGLRLLARMIARRHRRLLSIHDGLPGTCPEYGAPEEHEVEEVTPHLAVPQIGDTLESIGPDKNRADINRGASDTSKQVPGEVGSKDSPEVVRWRMGFACSRNS